MNRYCFRCNHKVEKETDKDLKKKYPYFCPYCDENMFTFETYIKKEKNYYEKQEEIRQKAIDWQLEFGEHNYSWGEIAEYTSYFYKMGKRYGLLKEFKENGIC